MRYLIHRLRGIRSAALIGFVAFTDLALYLGIVPFELYCHRVLIQHTSDTPFLMSVLGTNLVLILILLCAMAASALLFGRGVSRAARAAAPMLRRRTR